MYTNKPNASPLEDWTDTPLGLGNEFLIKRDDLLPFPLAGNKVRKLHSELAHIDVKQTVLVTVGAITSNHCRTTALLAAQRGGRAHLVLHGAASQPSSELALHLLEQLGATWEIVAPHEISAAVGAFLSRANTKTHFIAGGCHTPAAVNAYAQAVVELSTQLPDPPDLILLASGTGATQAGLIAGCQQLAWHKTRVLGVSVARTKDRGVAAIEEALGWVDCHGVDVEFTDDYRAGGYGQYDDETFRAVSHAWSCGLPSDTTYTGKALQAWADLRDTGRVAGTTVFWHTGGLATHLLSSLAESRHGKGRPA